MGSKDQDRRPAITTTRQAARTPGSRRPPTPSWCPGHRSSRHRCPDGCGPVRKRADRLCAGFERVCDAPDAEQDGGSRSP
jgi:hypothetical protein